MGYVLAFHPFFAVVVMVLLRSEPLVQLERFKLVVVVLLVRQHALRREGFFCEVRSHLVDSILDNDATLSHSTIASRSDPMTNSLD